MAETTVNLMKLWLRKFIAAFSRSSRGQGSKPRKPEQSFTQRGLRLISAENALYSD